MSNAIEIEAKALIDKDSYHKVMGLFKGAVPYSQTNYYIDNEESELKKEGIALRIRRRDGKLQMTLKTPLSQGLLEKNEDLAEWEFVDFETKGDFPENDLKRFLTMLDIDAESLRIITSLTTKRVDIKYKGGLLSIDENYYSGRYDYEIELEYNNMKDAERLLKELLDDNKIPYTLTNKTKTARALEAVGR